MGYVIPENLYSSKKAVQMAFYFYQCALDHDRELTPQNLNQFLYATERRNYKSYGDGAMFAQLVSTPQGPVLRQVTDELMNNQVFMASAMSHASFQGIQDLGEISDAEVKIMQGIWEDYLYGGKENWERSYHSYPEWDSSVLEEEPIYLERFLFGLGFPQSCIPGCIDYIESRSAVEIAFSSTKN